VVLLKNPHTSLLNCLDGSSTILTWIRLPQEMIYVLVVEQCMLFLKPHERKSSLAANESTLELYWNHPDN